MSFQLQDSNNMVDMSEFLTPRQLRRLSKKDRRKYNKQLQGNTQLTNDRVEYLREVRQLLPKNEKQQQLLKSINTFDQVICFGPAGTGKTYVIAARAAQMFLTGKIKKIVITRANVPTGRSLGFFPGSADEKMMVWVQPVVQVLKEFMGDAIFDIALKRGDIVLQPLETIRGMSFSDTFVIVDEAQNIQIAEIKALLTRIGEGSVLVLNGDISQSDLKGDSGLQFVINSIHNNKKLAEMTSVINFTSNDIVRSELCKQWVIHFDNYENKRKLA